MSPSDTTTMTEPDTGRTLWQPLVIGRRTLRNRVTRAATTTNLARNNLVTDELIAHYQLIAAGGTAMIVTDALRINTATLGGTYGIAAFRADSVPGLNRLADAIHADGALVVGQLNHSGRQHTGTSVPGNLVGPSAVACPRSGGVPHPLSYVEIEALVDGFVTSALNLDRAGFDGVELNGAQGHLLQQFLSPFSNRRQDNYGGSEQARANFAREILTRIRGAVRPDFIVGYRLGTDEFTAGGLTTSDTARFAQGLSDDKLIDYVSLSQGNFNSIAAHLPDRHYPPTPFAQTQREVAEGLTGVTRIACTRIRTPQDAGRLVADGWADAVALGRALTADPAWPMKAESGRDSSIRPCVQCNFCWSGQHEGTSTLACIVNPEVGIELKAASASASATSKRVVVVGGGAAGLEVARVAATRGHHVTLFEMSPQLGGKAGPTGGIGGHEDFPQIGAWLAAEVNRLGVDLRLGAEAHAEDVLRLEPDHVVVATGAVPVAPAIETDSSVTVVPAVEDLPADLKSKRVLVLDEDGHYWAAQVAEEAASRGAEVVVLTRFFEPFRELPIVSRIAALARLDNLGTTLIPMHEVIALRAGGADIKHYDSRRDSRVECVDYVVCVGPQLPRDELAEKLSVGFPPAAIHVIGDAKSPRRLRNAIAEGYSLAMGF